MKIYIDADACPNPIKELVYRTSERLQLEIVLVANQYIRIPMSKLISMVVVAEGADMADDKIVELCEKGDLVVTADIPLADRVVTKGAYGIDPRGELYTVQNIKAKLSIRDFMAELRTGGAQLGGPKPFSNKDVGQFANALDKFLHSIKK